MTITSHPHFEIGHPNLADITQFDEHLYITSSGTIYQPRTEVVTSRLNGRDDYHLLYIHDGEITLTINNTPYTLYAGDLAFIDYNVPHVYTSNSTSYYHWLHFKGTFAQQLLQDCGFYESCVLKFPLDEKICQLFSNITNKLNFQEHMYTKYTSIYLTEILISFHEKLIESHNLRPNSFKQFDKVQSLMRSPAGHDLTIDDFAKMCHLSKSRFIKNFKKATGYTPIEYRNHAIIDQAKWHLKNTCMSVAEISDALGFLNPSYFSTLFKKYADCTPIAYRKKHS